MHPISQNAGNVQTFFLNFESLYVNDSLDDLALALLDVRNCSKPAVGLENVRDDEVDCLGGQPSSTGVLIVFSQAVKVLDFLLKSDFSINQDGFDKDFSQEYHLVVGVFGEDFVNFGEIGFEGFGVGEGLIDKCLEVFDEELGVHEDFWESDVAKRGYFEFLIFFVSELIDGIFHFVEDNFESFDFLEGIVVFFVQFIIEQSVVNDLFSFLLIDKVLFLKSEICSVDRGGYFGDFGGFQTFMFSHGCLWMKHLTFKDELQVQDVFALVA